MSGRCEIDPTVERHLIDGFAFPLGVYPVEPMTPISGYTVAFEPADGGDDDALGATGLHSGIGHNDDDDSEPDDYPASIRSSATPGRDDDDDDADIASGSGASRASSGLEDDDDERPDTPSRGNGGLRNGAGNGAENGGGAGVGGGDLWPDRYVYEIVVPSNRLAPLCRALFSLLPPRVYPILEFLGHDEYREVDPYVSYDLIGLDRFLETVRRLRGFLFEDGLVGFGAMSEDPFFYLFVDEHKVVTVRVEPGGGPQGAEALEKVLSAFDLEAVDAIAAADAATHEHRTVLLTPDDRTDLLNAEEIVEDLQDEWGLILNIDPTMNLDDEGRELGVTPWRCVVRAEPLLDGPPTKSNAMTTSVYAEVLMTAANLENAEIAAVEAVASLPTPPELEELVERKRQEEAAKKKDGNLPKSGGSISDRAGTTSGQPGPSGVTGGTNPGVTGSGSSASQGSAGTAGTSAGAGNAPGIGGGRRAERHEGSARRGSDEDDSADDDDLPFSMLDDASDPFAGLGIDEARGLMFTLVSADRLSRSAFREALPRTAVERVLWNIDRVYRSAWL